MNRVSSGVTQDGPHCISTYVEGARGSIWRAVARNPARRMYARRGGLWRRPPRCTTPVPGIGAGANAGNQRDAEALERRGPRDGRARHRHRACERNQPTCTPAKSGASRCSGGGAKSVSRACPPGRRGRPPRQVLAPPARAAPCRREAGPPAQVRVRHAAPLRNRGSATLGLATKIPQG